MGEPIFTKPITNWLARRRAKKEAARGAQNALHGQETDQLANVRDVFQRAEPVEATPTEALSSPGADQPISAGPTPSDRVPEAAEVSIPSVTQRPPDQEPIPETQLSVDLTQNVFARQAPPSSPTQDALTSEPQALNTNIPPTQQEIRAQQETQAAEPAAISRVRLEPDAENSSGEEPSPGVSAVRAVSAGRSDTPPRDVLAEGGTAHSRRPNTAAAGSEGQQRTPPNSREVLDTLPVSLKDIFRKKVVANPQVKALLNRHEPVDTGELVAELNEFAESIGARDDPTA